ncbi:hypothetical protein [Pseudoxanthomonas suwonensis]|uniref:XOO1806 family protein n=1 Tax=Pseudoxanthomonas suwonensis TaxID=314722 RepID=UPI001569824D|nr:hypothetical protein [Pseudoxanthomonas suwonensis]
MTALCAAPALHAQSRPASPATDKQTVLPVWNKGSGKVEAVLLLEPAGDTSPGARWRFGNNSLDAAFGLGAGDSLGLLCNGPGSSSISSLASHCMLASLGADHHDGNARRLSATTALNRPGGRFGLSAGVAQSAGLPAWLSADSASMADADRIEQNDLQVFGQRNLGAEAYVSIAGTYARARLIPLADAAPGLVDQWDSKSLSVGGGYGSFGASIIGRVVDVPGQPGKWEGLGLGLTWRTPWSGQLTVGAENVVTRGKNPFSPSNGDADEGTVPYVRYEQGL